MTRLEFAQLIAKDILFGMQAEESIDDIAMRITFTCDREGLLPPIIHEIHNRNRAWENDKIHDWRRD